MNITVTEVVNKSYRPLFASEDIGIAIATVEFDIPGDGVTTITFSHRDDDPEGTWCADSRIGTGGYPHFIHGEGERVGLVKSCANDDLVALIEGWMN